ncbi:MAG: glycine oxidase ThiO [Gammaproteobacteria bacterium]|nr:glycine oxidase ThiO [Gammaproteobacteria bacterium]MDP2141903.1 glycine oxidase ThiO [Gammaproteobacteria bacterium]MDP2347215.1 glycine oxidase ThiO [Gammaproteobacteria bacterium]
MNDYVVIGGGVIGLLLARELAAAGATVTILEQGQCCREASWAGGGIVSPLYPWRYSLPVSALAFQAQQSYPQLVTALRDETGIDPEFEQTGLLMLDADDEHQALDWAAETGRNVQKVLSGFINLHEPGLSKRFDRGLWMPEIANIRNPRLGQALISSLQNNPRVRILERTKVVSLVTHDGSVAHAEILREGQRDNISAGNFVVTAGAWSGGLLSDLGIHLPIIPVKGQMLLFRPDRKLTSSILLTAGRYLIPRRDNHLLVGSTLEHTDFDKSTTEEGLSSLYQSAIGLLPELAEFPVIQQWAGLRPGAPQGIPYIGRVGRWKNLYINAGHYRNGLVLAPASTRLLADLLLKRKPEIDPSPYDPYIPH